MTKSEIRSGKWVLSIILLSAFGLRPSAFSAEPSKADAEFFEGKVRPILANNCYKCHSAEAAKLKAKLRLDTRDGVLKGGESGPAIVPGDPDKSLLIKAVRYTDPDLQMPPKGEKLSAEQVADLEKWVKMGAPDPRKADATGGAAGGKLSGLNDKARAHWAYQPVQKPSVPNVTQQQDWVKTPVDAFILAKLDASKMKPSAPASKETLLRRATFDLTGLPPTTQEIAAFLRDESPDAFEKVVDRLLASPHFGERWGRHWLDTARYSDTTGGDRKQRGEDYRYTAAWTYRDYVIRSFNEDKPYPQFITEQLAADKLPNLKEEDPRLAALGFVTVGERFNNKNDIINDRIDTTTKAFLGMTVSCARCHDHKFDPISQADYYALHGVFASTVEPREKPIISYSGNVKEYQSKYQEYLKVKAAAEQENREAYYRQIGRMNAAFREKAGDYLMVARLAFGNKSGAKSYAERYALMQKAQLDPEMLQAFRFRKRGDAVFALWSAFAMLPEENFAARAKQMCAAIGAKKSPMPLNPIVARAFANATPASMEDVAKIYGQIFASADKQASAYIAAAAAGKTVEAAGLDPVVAQLLEVPMKPEPPSAIDTAGLHEAVEKWPRRMMQRAGFAFAKVNEIELTHPGAPARAMVVEDAPNPRNSPIFFRGEAENRGPIVPRRFLEVFTGPNPTAFKDGSGRMELARAIATKDNPITARVAVNRIWLHLFGQGIVPTPDDLGVQSEPPSHPELINWLAATFVEQGWSHKKLIKLVMLSSAYQQTCDTNPAFETLDPTNRLVWRANIRRLDFESVRDSLLVFSGRLDPTMGGKPVNITDEPYSYRRSVYGYIDRGNVPELMSHFDFSDPDMPNSLRSTTIVPQQALFLMNSPMAVDVAEKMIQRSEFTAAADDAARIRALYRIVYQRAPRPQEIQIGLQFVGDGQAFASAAPEKEDVQPAAFKPNQFGKRFNKQQKFAPGAAQQNAQFQKAQEFRRKYDGRQPIHNPGEMVPRRPLTIWEQYAQALLFANEVAYVN
ncbi:MAG: PSD1 domain-containing protein [Verrucomicrobia bacterium]|nr:PSD1 domain-containing protein [Verrucomicrobiota bacterium]